ncbi:hypothetical protein ACVIGB_008366 [Bradyrhizobium sp. USDA 4341]
MMGQVNVERPAFDLLGEVVVECVAAPRAAATLSNLARDVTKAIGGLSPWLGLMGYQLDSLLAYFLANRGKDRIGERSDEHGDHAAFSGMSGNAPGKVAKRCNSCLILAVMSGRPVLSAKGSAAQRNRRQAALSVSTRPSGPGADLKDVICPLASANT